MEKRLEELAALSGGRVIGNGGAVITGVASIEDAGPGDITFFADKRHSRLLNSTRASAVIVDDEKYSSGEINLIVAKNPQIAFAKVVEALRPQERPAPGIHPRAEVHGGAVIGEGASVQAFAVVEDGAVIGDRAILYPGVYVGKGARIGDDAVLYPGVSVREACKIGSRVIIHSNAVVGSDGFGYARDGAGYYKIPQKGIVRIEDDVEIGACVTIDRATMGETVIGRGTKIDNLVQIAHNVKVGEDTVIAAQSGVAGSAKVGSRVQMAGQVGVAPHIGIGDDAMIGAKSGVSGGLPPKGVFSGIPAIPHGDWLRAATIYGKLPELKRKISELEKRLEALENKKG